MCKDEHDVMAQFEDIINYLRQKVETDVVKLEHNIDGGLTRGKLYLVSGRPTMGKTSLVLDMCNGIMQAYDEKILFYSLEMNADNVRDRLKPMKDEETLKKLVIIDSPNVSIPQIRAKVKNMMRNIKTKINVLFIDYLQLITGQITDESDSFSKHKVKYVFKELKKLAEDFNIPVLITAQLSNRPDYREDHLPVLADINVWDEMEEYVDVAIMLYRESFYYGIEGNPDSEIIIAKNNVEKLVLH